MHVWTKAERRWDSSYGRRAQRAHFVPMEALKDYLSGVPITHGQPIIFKKSTFQAHAAPARTEDDVAWVLNFLRRSEKWKGCQYMPHAYRIAMDVSAAAVAENDDVAEALPSREGSEDHGESGAGDKLLHLLRRWGIQNIVLVLTRFDAGPPGRLGAQRFCVLQDRATGFVRDPIFSRPGSILKRFWEGLGGQNGGQNRFLGDFFRCFFRARLGIDFFTIFPVFFQVRTLISLRTASVL